MQPHAIGWDVDQRVIERLDLDLRIPQKRGVVEILEARVTAHRQVGAIQLQQQTRLHDFFVFRPHGFGHRLHVFLMRRVKLIGLEYSHGAGRHCVQEAFGDAPALSHGIFHAGNVLTHGLERLDLDFRLACGPFISRRMAFLDQLVAIIGKIVQILRGRALRIAFESRQPVTDVSGVAYFAHLAIADDVHAGFDLMLYDIGHRAAHRGVELRRIVGLIAILREQQVHRCLRPRQTADVSGEDAVGTQLHD